MTEVASTINETTPTVIVSKVDYIYGVENNKSLPTSELAVNYDNLIEGPTKINKSESDTFLILGADNAYLDMAGWLDPKAILDNVQILVLGRGKVKTFDEKKDTKITVYYETRKFEKGAKVKYGDIIDDRKEIYGNYDLDNEMKTKTKQLEISVPEISSSLIRKLIQKNFSDDDVSQINKILEDLKNNGLTQDININNASDIESKSEILIQLFTPISLDKLNKAYRIAQSGGKSRRKIRNSKKNKRKTKNKRRNKKR